RRLTMIEMKSHDAGCRRLREETTFADPPIGRLWNFSCPPHSPLIPASLMIGPHIAVSDASRAASSAGVETTTGAPIASYLSLTNGCCSAATVSVTSLLTISLGVLAWTYSPHQGETSKPGMDSAMAGMSGAAGERFGDVTGMPPKVLVWGGGRAPGRGVEHGIDTAWDEIVHGKRGAPIGHVRHLDAGPAFEQFATEMGRGADAGVREGGPATVGFGVGDELVDCFGRRGIRHHHQIGDDGD